MKTSQCYRIILHALLCSPSIALQAAPAEYPYFALANSLMLLHASQQAASAKNLPAEVPIHMPPRVGERPIRDFQEEMQAKVRAPGYRLGNRRHDLCDRHKHIMDILLASAQPTHPLGFTDVVASILFHGSPGTGKSYAAEAWVGEINAHLPENQRPYSFLPITTADLNQDYSHDETNPAQAFVQCLERNRPVIAVIDDAYSRYLERTTPELWTQLETVKAARDICVIGITNKPPRPDATLQNRFALNVQFDYISDIERINTLVQYHIDRGNYHFSQDIVWPYESLYYRYIKGAELSHREIESLIHRATTYVSIMNEGALEDRIVTQEHVDAAWKRLMERRDRPWMTKETWDSVKEKIFIGGALFQTAAMLVVITASLKKILGDKKNRSIDDTGLKGGARATQTTAPLQQKFHATNAYSPLIALIKGASSTDPSGALGSPKKGHRSRKHMKKELALNVWRALLSFDMPAILNAIAAYLAADSIQKN